MVVQNDGIECVFFVASLGENALCDILYSKGEIVEEPRDEPEICVRKRRRV